MKTKKLLTMLLVMVMMLAAVGTFVGCGAKDEGKQVEAPGNDTGKKDTEEPQATATPEPTATPTPEVLPTAEELFAANEDMFDEKMKMTMKFAYKGQTEYGEMSMSIDAVQSCYDNITYQNNVATISMLGISEQTNEEVYYVDDKESSLRTEYSFDSETGVWVKSQYAYIELEEEEDTEESPLEGMANIEITQDDKFFYLSGELDSTEVFGDEESLGMDGLEMGTTSCKIAFDKTTKKVVNAEVVIKFNVPETEDATMSVDDFVIKVEALTEPIVIPEEALNAELDTEIEIDWEIDDDEDDNLPEPEKYTKDEMPEGWGEWYDEYNCKSGTFMMSDEETYESIPVTVYAKENWYFDNQYKYSLYLAVDDPAVCDYAPAYEVDYGDSYVSVTEPEKAAEELVEADFSENATVADVVTFVCNEKQCYYLDASMFDTVRSYIIFQDIGLDSYVHISIVTTDLTTDPLELIEMFLLNITSGEGEAI